jgi:hypothetical protein
MRIATLLAVAAIVGATPAAAANLLLNGSFEADDASASPYYIRAVPQDWIQVGGFDVVDIIHNTYTQGPAVLLDAQDGDQFLDMNGALSSGGIYQDVLGLTPGERLSLSLYVGKWAQNGPGRVTYSLFDLGANQLIASGFTDVVTDGIDWAPVSVSGLTTSGDVRVQITGQAFFQAGPGVDNVTLVAGVPEPSAWAMMILGFFGTGALIRTNRRGGRAAVA